MRRYWIGALVLDLADWFEITLMDAQNKAVKASVLAHFGSC